MHLCLMISVIIQYQLRMSMSQDSQLIHEPSSLDEEFAYINEITETPNRPYCWEMFYSLEDAARDLESSNQKIEHQDAFGEPAYFKIPTPTSMRNTKQALKNLQQITLQCPNPLTSQTIQPVQKKGEIRSPNTSGGSLGDESCEKVTSGEKKGQIGKVAKSGKSKKVKKNKREQYPTKNFLPSFRTSFLNFISKSFQNYEQFQSFEIIKRIRGKPCINLQDYQDLFKQEEFRPSLITYFKNKVIFRDLMQSRIEYSTKCEYFKRIHVFEEAFVSGEFKRINY